MPLHPPAAHREQAVVFWLIIYCAFVAAYLSILNVPLSVDQSLYLRHAARTFNALFEQGPRAMATTLLRESHIRPYLTDLLYAVSFAIFGMQDRSPLILNAALHMGCALAFARFTSASLGVGAGLSLPVYLLLPYFSGMVFDYFPELPLAAAVLAFHIVFLRWHLSGDSSLGVARALALGAILGLALLAKQTAPIFFVGPALALVARIPSAPRLLISGAGIVLLAALIAATYYVPNFQHVYTYTINVMAEGGGYSIPLWNASVHLFWYYLTPTYIVLLVASLLALMIRWDRLDDNARSVCIIAAISVAAAFVVVLSSANSQPRFLFPALPLIAIMICAGLAILPPALRVAAIAAVACNFLYHGSGLREYLLGRPVYRLTGLLADYSFNTGFFRMPIREPGLSLFPLLTELKRQNDGRVLTIMFVSSNEFMLSEYLHWQAIQHGWTQDRIFRVVSPDELAREITAGPDYVLGWQLPPTAPAMLRSSDFTLLSYVPLTVRRQSDFATTYVPVQVLKP
jgi:4-amino-4-deoxy-L-arabinose transferase-like glycosyltransferase